MKVQVLIVIINFKHDGCALSAIHRSNMILNSSIILRDFMGLPPSEHQRVPLGLILVRRNWQAKSRLSGRLFVDLARRTGLCPSADRAISCADNWSATPQIAVGPPKS
jgi:hypothetical protein